MRFMASIKHVSRFVKSPPTRPKTLLGRVVEYQAIRPPNMSSQKNAAELWNPLSSESEDTIVGFEVVLSLLVVAKG